MNKIITLFILTILAWSACLAQTETIIIEATKDNTIYSDKPENGSNGSGDYLFAGITDKGNTRRALVQFDLGSIPAETIIDSVYLTLQISKSGVGEKVVKIHKLTGNWGEAGSAAPAQEGQGAEAENGDATWNYAFFNTTEWNTSGGDFESIATASAAAGNSGALNFTSDELTSQINGWLSDAGTNFGWIVIGDESDDRSTKRFYSRENADTDKRPRLTVFYQDTASRVFSTAAEKVISILNLNESKQILIKNTGAANTFNFRIISITGALIEQKDILVKNGNNLINLSAENAGIYFVVLENRTQQFSNKIVIF